MKNENRIVELLAQSLQVHDRQAGSLVRLESKQEEQQKLLDVLVQGQAQLLIAAQETNKSLREIKEELKDVAALRREIERIKKYIGM